MLFSLYRIEWNSYPIWDSLGFLDLGGYFLSHFREFFNSNLLKYFLILFFSSFWDPYNSNVGAFNTVPKIFETVLNSFHFFFLYSAVWQLLRSSWWLIVGGFPSKSSDLTRGPPTPTQRRRCTAPKGTQATPSAKLLLPPVTTE